MATLNRWLHDKASALVNPTTGLKAWRVAATALLALAGGAANAFDLQFNSITDVDPSPTRGVLAYTVVIENSGATTANDVRTVFAIPAGAAVEGGALALPTAANANCAVSGSFVVCTHGNLQGTALGAGTPPITFTLRFRTPSTLPAPPNVSLRAAIGLGAPPLGSAQAAPAALFAAGSPFFGADTNEVNNVQDQQTTLEDNADLLITQSANPNPALSAGVLTYTVTATNSNTNSNTTTGVRVLATLPAGVTYLAGSATGAGWTFSGPTAGVLTATRGSATLAPGASVGFTYQVTVNISSGTLTNNVEVNTDRNVAGALLDNNLANNTSSLAIPVVPSADLSMSKAWTGGSPPFAVGNNINFRLAVRNLGQITASDVVARDVLPAGHQLVASFPLPPAVQTQGPYTCRTNAAGFDDTDAVDAGRAARTILRCTRASMPVGAIDDIDFVVDTSGVTPGFFNNVATVSSSTPDPVPGNNSSGAGYTVLPDGADVELISFTKGPAAVASAGGTINNTIRVRNNGPRPIASNLQVFIALAAGESFGSSGPGWTCAAEAGGVRCTYNGPYPVAAGNSFGVSGVAGFPDLTFTTTASIVGTLTSTACVGGTGGSAEPGVTGLTGTTDPITSNDCSGAQGVRATDQRSDLSITKATSTPTGGDKVVSVSEDSVTYTLVVNNAGPDATSGVVVEDIIPGFIAGQTVVSICGYTGPGTCTPPTTANFPLTVGIFNCVQSAGTVTCSSGGNSMAVGAADTVTFVIRAGRALRDSLSQNAVAGCSSAGQFCNVAGVKIDLTQSGAALDPSTGNNEAKDFAEVHAVSNLQTTAKTSLPASSRVGVETAYTINYRNPPEAGSNLPAVTSPPVGQPAAVVFRDTFTLPANNTGFVLRSATIVTGAACAVSGITGGVVSTPGAGGTSYSTAGAAAGTVEIECPAVPMLRNEDRQVRIVVRPNLGATGPLVNDATFRIVDSTGATVSASGANYNYNSDTTVADDVRSLSVPYLPSAIDMRVENDDLLDPVTFDPADINTLFGSNDIVYRVQVRNAGPSVATQSRFDYTVTPPAGATVRFIGDEGGTAVTMTSGAATPSRCVVQSGSNPVVAPATLTLRCSTPGFGFSPSDVDGVIAAGTAATDGAYLNLRFRYETVPSPGGATVSTNAVVTAAEPESPADSSNNSSAEITTIRSKADLSISKTAVLLAVPALPAGLPTSVSNVGLGQPFTWVVTVNNLGPGDSLSRTRTGTSPLNGTGTVITDTLPAGVTLTGTVTWEKTGTTSFVGAVPNGSGTCTVAASVITCNVGDVAAAGQVRISIPARWDAWPTGGGSTNLSTPQTNSANVASEQFDPVTANNSTTYDIRVTRSSLAGIVFEDRDRAGANSGTPQSAGSEPRIDGVTMVLRAPSGSDAYGNTFTARTTTTAGGGAYSFGDLPAGVYEIIEAQPTGFTNSPGDPTAAASGTSPSLGGTYTASAAQPAPAPTPAGANSRYSGITLGAQQDGVRYNFPEVAGTSLSGYVYIDVNLSNSFEAGTDVAIANATVILRNAANLSAVLASTTTAADGSYSFINLDPNLTYVLEQPLPSTPAGLTNRSTAVSVGTVNGSAVGTAAPNTPAADTDRITGISLAAGSGVQYNFGETLLSFISGTVYIDRDRNGSLTAGDPGRISGVTIRLVAGLLCTGTELARTTTDANGAYLFTSANITPPASINPSGTYSLCQVQPSAYGDGSTNPGTSGSTPAVNHIVVTNPPASGAANHNFGEVAGVIAGVVFLDNNNDGIQNGADAGLPTVTMTLTGGSLPAAGITANTAADGSFRFEDLPAGTYVLTEQSAQPQATVAGASVTTLNGTTTANTLAGTATAPGTTPSAVSAIVLPAGGQALNNLFAEILPAQISGSIYSDNNNDGVRQPGETGFANQTVNLVCTTDLGAFNTSTTTDASGNFVFTNLRPGSCTITQPTQPAGSTNGITSPGVGGGTGTPVATVPSAISGIVLTPGLTASGQLFGEIANTPDMVVTKTLAPATFTEQNRGTYTITVANIGRVVSSGVYTVTDTLPTGLTAVPSTTSAPNPRGTGWSCSVAGQTVTCTSSDAIAAGASSANTITLDVQVGSGVCSAGTYPCNVDNIAAVSGGGEPAALQPTPAELANPPLCTATPTQNVCRRPTPVQQAGGVSGFVWLDADHNRVFASGTDTRLPGFIVELYQAGALHKTTTTDAQGAYLFQGLVPGNNYEIRFKDPVTGAYYGRPVSTDPAGGNDPSASGAAGVVLGGAIKGFTVPGGNAIRINQNLPLDPSGVVYDSQTRQPVAGAVVELLGPGGTLVPAQCVLGGVNRITTATSGAGVVPGGYAFWLIAPAPAGCPGDGTYQVRVTPPAGYINAGVASNGSSTATSNLIPSQAGPVQIPASCQSYVAGAPCAVQNQASAPTGSQPTPYFFSVPLTPNTPATFVDVVNNHIPLDPFGNTRFVISKQASRATAEVGDSVTYTISVKHLAGPALPNVRVIDQLPAGFRYIPGTTRIGNVLQADPNGKPGPKLTFELGTLPINGTITFTYINRVGVGAQQGDGINTAQALSTSGAVTITSNIAKARVRVTGGVFTADACVLGKVYVDCNNNQVQDPEELGIPGVRLYMQDGTAITTDVEGKYSLCGLPPRTHVLKVDPLTLPRGSRLVTSSNRNVGDANSIFVDLKNGELHRSDFIEGSCSNTVLEQVKARRSQGEVRAVETEKKKGPALKFEGKAPGYPQQGTDSANQPNVKTRERAPTPTAPIRPSEPEQNTPVPQIPTASQNTQRPGAAASAPRP